MTLQSERDDDKASGEKGIIILLLWFTLYLAQQKMIRLTGDRARLDAKANNTYIVYKSTEGRIVREFADGSIIIVPDAKDSHNHA